MNKLITLYLTTITVVVHGRDCTSILELNDDNQYNNLICTRCKAISRFTSISANLTDELLSIVDETFTVKSKVRIHIS